ncbi:ABC transporter permease [Fulvivirgaceae bacterium BMA10]|uniref:ABC transporter permease n=1 Tax=Splendidivirga corallicola TaxID=3051826 RepID=A0ABT8KW90_9BACT|nr:ABC transporter permease [Fulvivirgaceae bacterium BMA10]
MLKIFKYSFFDLIRSRWIYAYFSFYLITAISLLYISNDLNRAILSLMNIVIILSPLIGTMFGVMYYYNSREFVELLLAQPVKRTAIFLGQYLGLTVSFSLSFGLGLGLPFLFNGILGSEEIGNFLILLLNGTLLTFIFTAIAFLISLLNENKIKGFGLAIIIWLFFAVIYDGLFLLSLVIFEDYPLDSFALIASIFNPIDLSRIFMMLQLDISALLGYTGAVFNKFLGTNMGIVVALISSLLWVFIPVKGFLHYSLKKDF